MRKPDKRQRKGPKQGLTFEEAMKVQKTAKADRERWASLLAVNKWREIK